MTENETPLTTEAGHALIFPNFLAVLTLFILNGACAMTDALSKCEIELIGFP
jgi:hypothetical protein